jgi:adenine deaminase
MPSLTRFSVKPLSTMTRQLAAVASGRTKPDLVIRDAKVLSTYSERMLPDREIWLTGGRIAAVNTRAPNREFMTRAAASSRPAWSIRTSTSNPAW